MRLYLPVGGGAYARTGCVLTPVVLLVWVVFWAAVATFWVAYWLLAGMVLALAWTGFGCFWAAWQLRLAYARRKARRVGGSRTQPPRDDPPDNPARWSDRR